MLQPLQSKAEKVKFLTDLKAGKSKIADVQPIRFVDLQQRNGITKDETGKVYSADEITTMGNFSKTKIFLTILTYE